MLLMWGICPWGWPCNHLWIELFFYMTWCPVFLLYCILSSSFTVLILHDHVFIMVCAPFYLLIYCWWIFKLFWISGISGLDNSSPALLRKILIRIAFNSSVHHWIIRFTKYCLNSWFCSNQMVIRSSISFSPNKWSLGCSAVHVGT